MRRSLRHPRQASGSIPSAPLRRPGAVGLDSAGPGLVASVHPLGRADENARLRDYEHRVKSSFDDIVPTLRRISALQHEEDFEARAQELALRQLGFALPSQILADAWVDQLDMRRLFSWCVFETYRRFCADFFGNAPLADHASEDFQGFLQACGFHTLDISPCADGRLAHVVRYVLRLPYRGVRRKSYAGAMFDVEDSIQKWVETEMLRFREGRPNTADAPTRYLKAVVYHFSSVDPAHEGCAAHGSDTGRAAAAAVERLRAFQQAVQNSFCCGASIDLLLIGLDTDTDGVRIHLPGADGSIDLERFVDAREVYAETEQLGVQDAVAHITRRVHAGCPETDAGMRQLIARLIENNIAQIDYVRRFHGQGYSDIGHAERFIGAGVGFEEIQLRNLMYFAYMSTVEEAAADLDVGIKIFTGLNVAHGLPVPVVVRFDYHGQVPGSRERAAEHCARVARALFARYADLAGRGLLHCMQVIRDCREDACIEVLQCSVLAEKLEAH